MHQYANAVAILSLVAAVCFLRAGNDLVGFIFITGTVVWVLVGVIRTEREG